MFRSGLMAAAVAAVMAGAGGAAAQQPYDDYGADRERGERGRGRDAVVLYELPNFRGASVRVDRDTPNLSVLGFNDRAQSARLEGSWRLCEHGNYGGRCEDLQGAVPDLNRIGLSGRVSSVQQDADYDDGPDYGGPGYGERPGYGGGRNPRGVDGELSVFFPRPAVRGMDVAAGSTGANAFCRRQGLGTAVYFDSSVRAPRAVGPEGQFVGPSSVLRDLLCRKR